MTNQINEKEKANLPEGKVRKHYKSIMESEQVGESAKRSAKKLLETDTYVPISNERTLNEVNKNIAKTGLEEQRTTFQTKILNGDKMTLNDIATGERLIQIYSQKGEYEKANSLVQDVAILGTSLGQQVQALSLIKKMSKEGQLQYLTKVVERMNNEYSKKKSNKIDLKVTDEMAEKILSSKDKKDLENNMDLVKEELAKQIPATKIEQLDEWRYLAMLGNPKTHIRNIVSNTAMKIPVAVKNKIAGGMEDILGAINPEIERTKTLKFADKDTKIFAKKDLEEVKERLTTGGKYNLKSEIIKKKNSFNNKALNATVGKLAKWNSDLLEKEDWVALKPAYRKAMQNYMTANKLTAEYLQSETKQAKIDLEKAREYSINQAQEATFRQYSALANSLNEFSRKGAGAKLFTDAILPFKKTPINIAKAGVEYSPLGLLKSTTVDIYKLNKGEITVNKFIDNISKGLTGTTIAVLGYALGSMGMIQAGGGDDKDDKFKQDQGEQVYSVKIGDKTYTIDWLSPSAIPLFVGVEIYNNVHSDAKTGTKKSDDETTGSKVLKSTSNLAESMATAMNPMTEMSMLSGITSALSSYSRGSTDTLEQIALNGAKSYANQYIPTALGQVARTIDPKVRSTTTTQKDPISKVLDSTRLQAMSKIPGLSQMLPVKTDVWGNEQNRNENVKARALENAIYPWNEKAVNTNNSSVNNELISLYDKTGETKVLPNISISKDFTINGEKYTMTNEEYSKYKNSYGKISYQALEKIVNSKEYKNMNDEQKTKTISSVYEYANEVNKVNYAKENKKDLETSTLYKTSQDIIKQKGNIEDYFTYIGNTEGMKKDTEKREVLINSKYNDKTKRAIYINTIGSEDEIYSKIIDRTNININQYLEYKQQDFEGDKKDDGTVKGKTISGSGKKKAYDYVEKMDINLDDARLLLATKYSLTKTEKTQVASYVNTFKISAKEKLEIYGKLNGFYVLKNGGIDW